MWDEDTFLKNTEGSAIRRIGHERWQRNISIALGNAPYSMHTYEALTTLAAQGTDLVKEHARWALNEQDLKKAQSIPVLAIDDNTPLDDSLLTPQAKRLDQRLIRSIEKGLARDA